MLSPHKILKIIDLARPHDLGLTTSLALANKLDAELYLLHIVPENSIPIFGSRPRMNGAGEQLAALDLPHCGVSIHREMREGDVNNCIVACVEQRGIDLLIIDQSDTEALAGIAPHTVVTQLRGLLSIPIMFTDSANERASELVARATQGLIEKYDGEVFGNRQETLQTIQSELQNVLSLDDDQSAILVSQLRELHILERIEPKPNGETTEGASGHWRITPLELPASAFSPLLNLDLEPETSSAISLIQRALEVDATDIHIDPIDQEYTVQFRVDGRMHEYCRMQLPLAGSILKQIKLMANISLADPFHPSESRLLMPESISDFEVRVTTAPVAEGEAIAMRIINVQNLRLPLSEIGLTKSSFAAIYRMLHRRSGLVLIAGPTGAGKTTTAYSILNVLFNEQQKIVSIEDPVELIVPFMRQLAVDHRHEFTMNDALSTILRMDPDVVFIGEIRNTMAAHVALQAASSGKRTLSTIHMKDVSATVSAMREFDVDGRTLADSIAGVIAQRLVRRICPSCHERTKITQKEQSVFESQQLEAPADLVRARGCQKCRGTGYRGRIGIFEVVVVEDEVADAIRREVHESELRDIVNARGAGLMSDGLLKVKNGITTLDELQESSWLADSVDPATRIASDEIYERSASQSRSR